MHDHRARHAGCESEPISFDVTVTVTLGFTVALSFCVDISVAVSQPECVCEPDRFWRPHTTVHAHRPDRFTSVANQPADHVECID